MSDSLKYELTVSTKNATKEMDKTVKKVKKDLTNVPVTLDTSKAEKATYKMYQFIKKQQEAMYKEIAKKEADRFKIQEAAEKQRIKYEKERLKLIEKREQQEQKVNKAHAAAIAMLEKEEKLRNKAHGNALKMLEREQKAAKKPEQARIKELEDFLHRRTILEAQYGARDEELTQRHQQVLRNIEINGHKMRLVDIQRMLQMENVLYSKSLQKKAQEKQQYTLFGTSFSNKTNQGLFQMQQIVEDFSYAGWRGASNNVAMLASQMGGKGGLIAVGAVTALTLASVAKELGVFDGLLPDATANAEKFARALQQSAEARAAMFDDQQGISLGSSTAQSKDQLIRDQERLDFLNSENSKLREQKAIMEDLVKANRMYEMGVYMNEPKMIKMAEVLQQSLSRQLMTKHGMSAEDISALQTSGLLGMGKMTASGPAFDQVNKQIQENESDLGKQQQLAQQHKRRARTIEELTKAYKDMLEVEYDFNAELTEEAEGYKNISDQLDKFASKQAKIFNEERKQKEEEAKVMAESYFRDYEKTGNEESRQKALDIITRTREEIAALGRQTEGLVDEAKQWADLWGTAGSHVEDYISATEKSIDLERRQIEAIEKRIEALKKAKEENQTSHLGSMFDLDRGIARKQAGENQEKFTEQNKQGLEWALRQNEMMFAPPQVKQMRAEQIKNFFEQREKFGSDNIEKGLQRREAAIQAQHEKLLKDRANQFGANGDHEGQLDALKEVYALQMQQAGQAQTSQQMMVSKQSVEKTQKEIQALYDTMAQAEEQKKQEEQANLSDLEGWLKKLQEMKLEINQASLIDQTDVERAKEIEKALRGLGDFMNQLNQGNGDMPGDPLAGVNLGGVPIAGVGTGGNVNNTSNVSNTTNNNYNVNVAGMPSRPSLTMREAAQFAEKQSKMRLGVA